MVRSEAERIARADAVFVGELVGSRVDPSASPRETRRIPYPAPMVLTFKASRVVKGAVRARQEVVTPGGGGAGCGGFGIGLRGTGPFLVFAYDSAGDIYRVGPGQYASNLCSGARALGGSGTPAPGGAAGDGCNRLVGQLAVSDQSTTGVDRQSCSGSQWAADDWYSRPAGRLALHVQPRDWPRATGCSGRLRTDRPQNSTSFQG